MLNQQKIELIAEIMGMTFDAMPEDDPRPAVNLKSPKEIIVVREAIASTVKNFQNNKNIPASLKGRLTGGLIAMVAMLDWVLGLENTKFASGRQEALELAVNASINSLLKEIRKAAEEVLFRGLDTEN